MARALPGNAVHPKDRTWSRRISPDRVRGTPRWPSVKRRTPAGSVFHFSACSGTCSALGEARDGWRPAASAPRAPSRAPGTTRGSAADLANILAHLTPPTARGHIHGGGHRELAAPRFACRAGAHGRGWWQPAVRVGAAAGRDPIGYAASPCCNGSARSEPPAAGASPNGIRESRHSRRASPGVAHNRHSQSATTRAFGGSGHPSRSRPYRAPSSRCCPDRGGQTGNRAVRREFLGTAAGSRRRPGVSFSTTECHSALARDKVLVHHLILEFGPPSQLNRPC
jgi:hypothetical protein